MALLKLDDRRRRPLAAACLGSRRPWGLVVEGFGGGHVTREIAESTALAELVETVPVVLSTRSVQGKCSATPMALPAQRETFSHPG